MLRALHAAIAVGRRDNAESGVRIRKLTGDFSNTKSTGSVGGGHGGSRHHSPECPGNRTDQPKALPVRFLQLEQLQTGASPQSRQQHRERRRLLTAPKNGRREPATDGPPRRAGRAMAACSTSTASLGLLVARVRRASGRRISCVAAILPTHAMATIASSAPVELGASSCRAAIARIMRPVDAHLFDMSDCLVPVHVAAAGGPDCHGSRDDRRRARKDRAVLTFRFCQAAVEMELDGPLIERRSG